MKKSACALYEREQSILTLIPSDHLGHVAKVLRGRSGGQHRGRAASRRYLDTLDLRCRCSRQILRVSVSSMAPGEAGVREVLASVLSPAAAMLRGAKGRRSVRVGHSSSIAARFVGALQSRQPAFGPRYRAAPCERSQILLRRSPEAPDSTERIEDRDPRALGRASGLGDFGLENRDACAAPRAAPHRLIFFQEPPANLRLMTMAARHE